jgi:hypothetical protein
VELIVTDTEYRFVEEWDTNSPIGWWNEGRTKLNEIIKPYNQWQIDGFNKQEIPKLRAQIIYGLQTFATRDGGSEWARELQEMLEFVERHA